jgi:membrane-associated phospholipid phosphatase
LKYIQEIFMATPALRYRAFALIAFLAMYGNCHAEDVTDRAVNDIKLYFTAPVRWDQDDWLFFGGTVAATLVAHHYDEDVRSHFLKANPNVASDTSTHDAQDAVPAAIALVGTGLFAAVTQSYDGKSEAWAMVEATALSSITGYGIKWITGRERPNETADPNSWRAGGDSFPSLHTTAAFAIGTVLAESGSDDVRWIRRVVGYGVGAYTGYARLKHNRHWLSDTVAGASLGIASARFAMNRRDERRDATHVYIEPTVDGGVTVTVAVYLH